MAPTRKPLETFRRQEARDYAEGGIQTMVEPSPAVMQALGRFHTSGGGAGQHVTLAYSRPGFSLTHVWFKSGYPLPLHSHSGDCLYYILAGRVRVGAESLGPGDGFFVASDVAYTYEVGPDGVEVLEFRATDELDIRFRSESDAVWDKTIATLEARREIWEDEPPPSQTQAG
jgi:hypothetical protein